MKWLQIPKQMNRIIQVLSQAVFPLVYLKSVLREKIHVAQSDPHQKLENKPSTESIEKKSWGIKTTKNNYCKTAAKREKRWLTLKDGSYREGWLLLFPMSREQGGVTRVVSDLPGFWAGSGGNVPAALRCTLVYNNGVEESIAI